MTHALGRLALPVLLALLLAACGALKADEDARRLTEAAYADLVLGRDGDLIARFVDPLAERATRDTFEQMRGLIPEGPAEGSELVAFTNGFNNGESRAAITLRYRYASASVVVTGRFTRRSSAKPWWLTHIDIGPDRDPTGGFGGERGPPPPAKPSRQAPTI